VARQVKIWFQNRRSKYKKLLKQFGLSAGRVPGSGGGAVMESTVSSDLPECPTAAAAAAIDTARIKSSPQSFQDDSPDGGESAAAAATSTTTDDLTSIEYRVSCGGSGALLHRCAGGVQLASNCWPAASLDSSHHYLAAAAAPQYEFTSCMTAAATAPAAYSAAHQDLVSAAPRTTCYQPWCLSAEHCHHHLFT